MLVVESIPSSSLQGFFHQTFLCHHTVRISAFPQCIDCYRKLAPIKVWVVNKKETLPVVSFYLFILVSLGALFQLFFNTGLQQVGQILYGYVFQCTAAILLVHIPEKIVYFIYFRRIVSMIQFRKWTLFLHNQLVW